MAEQTITCPHCRNEIKLTESLAAPLLDDMRRDYEERLQRKDADFADRETVLRSREAALAKARESIDDQVMAKLKEESTRIAAEEARKAKQAYASDFDRKEREVKDLQELLTVRESKLAQAQQAQADLIRKQRELDDAKRELDLTVEKRVGESLVDVRQQALKETEEQFKLKVQEREHTILAMQRHIEELKRRAEQGSQQLQGEVQELELESVLRAKFPRDTIHPVPKGVHGGDVLHRVLGPLGQLSGTVLWECKRTKNWSDTWLVKLREDQRAAKADVAVVISHALRKDVETIELIDHVWVAHPRFVIPLATILRQSLIELSLATQANEGQQTKAEMIYQYLTGPRFRQRIQAIVEAFSSMQEDLDREKKAITKQWSKREEQIERVMQATVGMYGDVQGIAGKTLQEIEGLDFLVLENGHASIAH